MCTFSVSTKPKVRAKKINITSKTEGNIDIVIEIGGSCYLYSSGQAIPSLQVLRMQ